VRLAHQVYQRMIPALDCLQSERVDRDLQLACFLSDVAMARCKDSRTRMSFLYFNNCGWRAAVSIPPPVHILSVPALQVAKANALLCLEIAYPEDATSGRKRPTSPALSLRCGWAGWLT
jgi:hypothetical protein